jgi:hypothetical protein
MEIVIVHCLGSNEELKNQASENQRIWEWSYPGVLVAEIPESFFLSSSLASTTNYQFLHFLAKFLH